MIAKEKIVLRRATDEIRPISCEVGHSARVHGSHCLQGEKQALFCYTRCVSDVQVIDRNYDEEFKRYMHHYNFPSYSVENQNSKIQDDGK
jgi:polyribonucleotide nucleotidyltransferase